MLAKIISDDISQCNFCFIVQDWSLKMALSECLCSCSSSCRSSFTLTQGLPVLIHRSVLGTASFYTETVRSKIKLIIWEVTPFSPTAAQYVHATDIPNKPKHLLYCQLLHALKSCISTICSSFFFNLLDGGNEDLSTRCKPICPGRVAGVHRAAELRIILISSVGGSACGQMDSICEIVCHAEGMVISSLSKKSFYSPRWHTLLLTPAHWLAMMVLVWSKIFFGNFQNYNAPVHFFGLQTDVAILLILFLMQF